jgi:hypothetical protein
MARKSGNKGGKLQGGGSNPIPKGGHHNLSGKANKRSQKPKG